MSDLEAQLTVARDVFKRLGETEERLRQKLIAKHTRTTTTSTTHSTSSWEVLPLQPDADDTALPSGDNETSGQLSDPIEAFCDTPPPEQNLQVLAERAGWRCHNNDARSLSPNHNHTATSSTPHTTHLQHSPLPPLSTPRKRSVETRSESSLETALGLKPSRKRVQKSPEKEEHVFVLTIELQEGKEVSLVVKGSDDAEQVAEEFLQRNGLSVSLVTPVAERIREALVVLQEEARRGDVGANVEVDTEASPTLQRGVSQPHGYGDGYGRSTPSKSPSKSPSRTPRSVSTPRSREVKKQSYLRPTRASSASRAPKVVAGGGGGGKVANALASVDPNVCAVRSPSRGKEVQKQIPPACERLYALAMKKRLKHAESAQKHRAQCDEAERQHTTFAPRISSAAQKMHRGRHAYLASSQRRGACVRGQEEEEFDLCTFAPQLSVHSKKLVRSIRCEAPTHDAAFQSLFLDAEMRKIRSGEREACAQF